MPRTSGTYSLPTNTWYPAVPNTVMKSTDSNATLLDMATAINGSLATDGSNASAAPIFNGTLTPITTGGGTTAYTLTTSMSLTGFTVFKIFYVKWNVTNTGAATLNVDGIGAVNLRRGSNALVAGDLVAGNINTVAYDGTNFQVMEANAPLDQTLATIAALSPTTDQMIYFTGTDTAATTGINANARTGLAGATSAAATILTGATTAGANMATAASATAQTALLSNFVGDSGSGGTKGLVPAPSTGDSGKLLRGDGTWATVGAVGLGAPIATWTYSSAVAQVDFTNLGSYSELVIVWSGISFTTTFDVCIRLSSNNGSSYDALGYFGPRTTSLSTLISATISDTSTHAAIVTLYNFNSGSRATIGQFTSLRDTSNVGGGVFGFNTARVNNAIRIFDNGGAGNFDAGSIQIYGRT